MEILGLIFFIWIMRKGIKDLIADSRERKYNEYQQQLAEERQQAAIYKQLERQEKEWAKAEKEREKEKARQAKQRDKRIESQTIIDHYEPIRARLVKEIAQSKKAYKAAENAHYSGDKLEKLYKPIAQKEERLFQIERKLEKAYFALNSE